MNTVVEPTMTMVEEQRFSKLSSLDFAHFWTHEADLSVADRILLFKRCRILENELIRCMEQNSTVNEKFDVYLKLGHVNLLGKDFPKALSAYQMAFSLRCSDFWKDSASYFGLGLVYFHFKAFQIASQVFGRLLYCYPNFTLSNEVHARLGYIYKNIENFELAVKHFNAALSDTRETTFLSKIELRFNIAHCYDIAGDLERASSEYRAIITDHPVQISNILRAQILRQLGWICYRTECTSETRHQKIFEAERYLTQSKEIEPLCGKTYYYLGRCYSELPDRAHDAFANYRHSIDKSEADADTWCSIGVLYQQQSQPMDALQAFVCAVQLDSRHCAAWSDLGRLYEVNCQFSDALHCFKKALQCSPVAPEALKARIRVLEKELHPSSLLIGNVRSLPPNKLPSLEEAWKLPIPSELSQRQEEFLKQKQQKYRSGASLFSTVPINFTRFQRRPRSNQMDLSSLPLVSQDDLINVLGNGEIKHEMISEINSTRSNTNTSTIEVKKEIIESDGCSQQINFNRLPSLLPDTFSLASPIRVPISIKSPELLERCRLRVEKPSEFTEIFNEHVPPPTLPEPSSAERLPVDKLFPRTPVVVVETRKDAHSVELHNFCYQNTITLMRGLTSSLRIDLSLFSTKSLLELAPDHEVEIRTQYQMPSDRNVDHLGHPTWSCHSASSYTTLSRYAQYQAQSFQYSLKEEAEKLRAASAKYGGDGNSASAKRRRPTIFEESPMPVKLVKFGTNVDLSDETKFRVQLAELSKMPAFCRLVAGCNMLTHLGHTVYGMNTVQLYMKVPGARTPGHVENNCLASVNINIGPGECEWFGVPFQYWTVIDRMLKKRDIDFLKGSWWPDLDELMQENVPVHRFVQKAGDLVWVNNGCIHWVHSNGWCNNVAWNVGPFTPNQLEVIICSHEWNKLNSYKSLIPVQHLIWQLARNVRFSNQKMFAIIKNILIKSFSYTKMIFDMLTAADRPIKMHPRQKGEVSHYCTTCEIEVWNLLFVREVGGKFPVFCVQCAMKSDLANFTVLQQYTFDDLCNVFDQFRFYPQSKTTFIC